MPKIIENLREIIILESKKLLLEKGYKNLNIREIARNCNAAIGTFYNYFSTKEELVVEILREDWKKISNYIDEVKLTEESSREKFRKIYSFLEKFLCNYMTAFYEMAVEDKRTGHGCREKNKYDILYIKVSELIDIEKNKGSIKSSLDSYKLAQLIISNLIYLSKNSYMSFDELYDSLNI